MRFSRTTDVTRIWLQNHNPKNKENYKKKKKLNLYPILRVFKLSIARITTKFQKIGPLEKLLWQPINIQKNLKKKTNHFLNSNSTNNLQKTSRKPKSTHFMKLLRKANPERNLQNTPEIHKEIAGELCLLSKFFFGVK